MSESQSTGSGTGCPQVVTLVGPDKISFDVVAPAPDCLALAEVKWGDFDTVMSPAYWRAASMLDMSRRPVMALRSGRCLLEEAAACLLGGYGITAELAAAAYDRIAQSGLLSTTPAPASRFQALLEQPFAVGSRSIRYRYPRMKASYLAAATLHFEQHAPPEQAVPLREWLLAIPGIGLKTASWIVRNWLLSDEVAILDVHVIRACAHIGLFIETDRVERDYRDMERRFLQLATTIGIPASRLDAVIWDQMRRYYRSWTETGATTARPVS